MTAAEADLSPEQHDALAQLAFADDDLTAVRRHGEAAFRGHRDAGDLRAAARAAMRLALLHANTLGNDAAGRGWLDRARRTLDRVGPCVEWGYLELALIACDRPDVVELEASAERALAIALEFDDHDLEVRALADSGLALVTQGHLQAGFDRLDSAMAAITAGEVRDLAVAGQCFCSMLTGCERAGDLHRVDEWVRSVREMTLEPNGGRPKVLALHCLLAYGSALATAGRWSEAEEVMLDALSGRTSRSVGHLIEITTQLARMRVEQGRLDEADALLAPYEDHVLACEPIARIRLLRGEPELAAATARRGLHELRGDALRGCELLARLVEAELALGNERAAASTCEQLVELSCQSEGPQPRAEAEMALGRLAAARGGHVEAIVHFDAARALAGERPFLIGVARLARAESLAATGDTASAIDEARAALATFERLGAGRGADRASALLRALGASGRARSTADHGRAFASLSAREAEVLDLIRQGNTNAEIASRLYISPKTAEHHVSRVLAKLGVRTRAEAAALAATHTGQ